MSVRAARLWSLVVSGYVAAVGLAAAGRATAQVPAPAQAPPPPPAAASGTVVGRVVDTTGVTLAGAEISIARMDSGVVVGTAQTAAGGRFVMRNVPVGGPYLLQARKIGYGAAQWANVQFHGGDTLRITFRLPLAPVVLPEVVAKGRGSPLTARRITAAQFNPGNANNALAVLGKYRPDMLGDPATCGEPPEQPVWRQQEQQQAQSQPGVGGTGVGGTGIGGTGRSFGGGGSRRPWLDSLYNVQTDPYSPYVLRVYINGIRRDYPGQSPLMVLRYLPADQVAEMYYADCHDTTVPIDMRYSVFVVLKPPSPEVQQRMLRHLMLPDSARAAAARGAPTRPEATAYRETSRYADVVALLDTLHAREPASLVMGSIGVTGEGRAIPLVVASRPRVATLAAARALARPIVYVNANIHAGEVEGKEAVLALLRDLAADPRPNVLDSLVLVVVPIYNADGNERVGPQATNRAEQNGPEQVGIRANAQGLDLNRDYVKAEAPETRAFLAAWRAWEPDVYVDLHTTDGSYHGYALTYSPPLNPNTDPYTRDVMLPAIRERMRTRHKYETFDYGNFDPEHYTANLTDTVKAGWYTFDGRPREGTNYVGLRGRIAILSEAFSHDPFERRIAVTRAFVQEILSYTAEHARDILARSLRADRPPRPGSKISVRSRLTPTPQTGPVLAEDLVATGDSSLTQSGVPRGYRRTGRIRTLQLPIYDRFVSTLDRPVPQAYVLDAADTAAVRLLALHGVQVDTLRDRSAANVETFVIDSTWTEAEAFQGHHARGVVGHWVQERDSLQAGSYLVPMSQPAALLAAYLLEPESDDGLVVWNVFDGSIGVGRRFPVRRVVAAPAAAPTKQTRPH